MATEPGAAKSTIPATTSTIWHCRSAPACSCGWPNGNWRPDPHPARCFRGDQTPTLPSPACGRAVRGKSGIAEGELILGILALWTAWVDGRGFVDGADVAALEEAPGDQRQQMGPAGK